MSGPTDEGLDSFESRITEESYRTYPLDSDSVSEVVIRAVATTIERDPLELDQLYGTVDPDALDDLFTDGPSASPTVDGQFIFSFSGCEIVISRDTVAVRPFDD